jgi:uncharacterized protein
MFETCTRSTSRLLIFARVPEPGLVKRRLAEDLGSPLATEVYSAMIEELLDHLAQPDEELDLEVMWTASAELRGAEVLRSFRDLRLSRQIGHDLGERLIAAFSERAVLHRVSKIVAIGTDLPDLERSEVMRAFDLLDSCDWVLGPAADGGYYLIGCRPAGFDTRVFEGVDWGSNSVLEVTRERIRELGATVALLPERRDVDRLQDLHDYVRRHPGSRPAAVLTGGGEVERSS